MKCPKCKDSVFMYSDISNSFFVVKCERMEYEFEDNKSYKFVPTGKKKCGWVMKIPRSDFFKRVNNL